VTNGESPLIRSLPDPATVSEALARAIVEVARSRVASHGRFSIALSGGETPRAAYQLLGSRYQYEVDWDKVHVFFTDERFVPPDDARNNAAMAVREWLAKVSIPRNQVHAIPTVGGTAADCAERYEGTLRNSFSRLETFDLAIMGIGPDGHTASLFPGDVRALEERHRWVVPVQAPAGTEPRERITLTLPALNGSRRVVFAAVGEAKRERVAEALAGRVNLPAALVHGRESTVWLLDTNALPFPLASE
jgi:6-phosphogluconolactonase